MASRFPNSAVYAGLELVSLLTLAANDAGSLDRRFKMLQVVV